MNERLCVTAGWRANIVEASDGIFFLHPLYGSPLPRTATIDGRVHYRFMDYIMLPTMVEYLSPDQISIVNALRLQLLNGGAASAAHLVFKDATLRYLSSAGVRSVVEWGCGFDPVALPLDTLEDYLCIDIDPAVVAFQNGIGVRCCIPTDPALTVTDRRFDVIIAIYVFHFRISIGDMKLMRRLVRGDGIILANVYRRSALSRARLARDFVSAGFCLATAADPAELSLRNEFWMLSPSRPKSDLQKALGVFLRLLSADRETTLGQVRGGPGYRP